MKSFVWRHACKMVLEKIFTLISPTKTSFSYKNLLSKALDKNLHYKNQ